jgi:hypothetical protein
METKIKCKYCGREIEISEALRHEVQEKILKAEREKHERELKEVEKKAEEKALVKLQKDFELQIKNLQKEREEERKRNTKLLKQLEGLNDEMRKLRRRDEERELVMKKKLAGEEEKIRHDARKKAEEESELKFSEYKKKLADTEKALAEAQRKAQQGSQQTQGEVLELDLEDLLTNAFKNDRVEPIGKGKVGADIRQTVFSPSGKTACGVILWEVKRTKRWNDEWVSKLKMDLRKEGADIPVIVTTTLPEEAKSGIGIRDGVWVCSRAFTVQVAMLLRDTLIKVAYQKTAQKHQGRKTDLIYEYVTSSQFVQQIEAIIETYSEMKNQVDKERAAFEKQWRQREGQLQRMIMATANVYGSMQGLAGTSALPEVAGLELAEPEK